MTLPSSVSSCCPGTATCVGVMPSVTVTISGSRSGAPIRNVTAAARCARLTNIVSLHAWCLLCAQASAHQRLQLPLAQVEDVSVADDADAHVAQGQRTLFLHLIRVVEANASAIDERHTARSDDRAE